MVTLTLGTPATRLAQEQLSEEALLFSLVGEPEESGIAPPGIRMGISEHAKLGVLVQIFGNGRFGTIYSANSVKAYHRLEQACLAHNVELTGVMINSPGEFPQACKKLFKLIDCFIMLPDTALYSPDSVAFLLRGGLKQGTTIVDLSRRYTQAGALSTTLLIGGKYAQLSTILPILVAIFGPTSIRSCAVSSEETVNYWK